MRLKCSKNSAEEELTSLLNDGYAVLDWIRSDYKNRIDQRIFTHQDNQEYTAAKNRWVDNVLKALASLFPTPLEANTFRNPPPPGFKMVPSTTDLVPSVTDQTWFSIQERMELLLRGLKEIMTGDLLRYTDLPIRERLYIEDIDSFKRVRDVNPEVVHGHLQDGYLNLPEDQVQISLEQILNEPIHKRDWGGEQNDLYTTNLLVNTARTPTAFVLKGNGLRSKMMQIADCGKNGDQLVRLFQSPAQLFIVQFVGNISESLITDIEGKVRELRSTGKAAHYCTINGQDTARLLYAYGKL